MNNRDNESSKATELTHLLGQFIGEVLRYDADDMLRLLKREDLSLPRIGALKVVARLGAASISDISVCLDLSLANTSILVEKLVCHGFVTRVEDANDRRQKRICLTQKGQALVQEVHATRVQHMVERMLQLPPDLLDRAIVALREVTMQLPDLDGQYTAGNSGEEVVRG